MSFSPQRIRRPLTEHGDHRVFDNEDFVEFVIRGDGSRVAIAEELSRNTQDLIAIGTRFAREFFTIPGEFSANSVEVHEDRSEHLEDFVMRCQFTPATGRTEEYTYVYFDFGFLFRPERTGPEHIRCVRFCIGVW